ncbi:NAD synthetase [Buchnera aphidicola (Schlechtendalia chinensis)]|uniref:NH(3)-dependent NAD(+) synthetase n=1 Tax=Buchnera aphidicola subsp. Schlechtendalia chinensis TaxID=118110 RepID=A0A172WE93_BUCSC|nr:ammonia-dependent NAD(+) synthetase [Buchnera aphidicola]ANF17298.1 NAD synthetase [Buchnera aphidicola (Schlechtendalia chinensis)]
MNLQEKIIKKLGVKPVINPKFEIHRIINFIKMYILSNKNIKSLILGISGGQDSTLTGKLCQLAIKELNDYYNHETYKLIALCLPYGKPIDLKDCKDAIKFINPTKIYNINIKPAVLSTKKSLQKEGIQTSNHIKANDKARERMKLQYNIASMNHGIVVGTDHAAEAITGFFTKYGDGGSDINPISELNKKQGTLLLKTLNCPSHLYLKKPRANLEDNFPYKTDEEVLGITYFEIDAYLEGKKIDKKSQSIIEKYYINTKHKRNIPITPNMFAINISKQI